MRELFRLNGVEKDLVQYFRLLPPDMKSVFIDILITQSTLQTAGDDNVVPFAARQPIKEFR